MFPRLGFLLAAILGILSFPPFGAWPLAFVAMVPFLAAAVSLSPPRAFRWGYLGGILFFGGTLYWIGCNSGAPPAMAWASAAVVIAILATVWGITAWAICKIAGRAGLRWTALLFVTLYVFFEVFWGTGELGFPWIVWGLTQTAFLPALQCADVADVYGLSLWVLALNALVFLVWKRALSRPTGMALIALTFVLPLLYGALRLWQFRSGERIAVAAVQANTPADEKWHVSAEEITESYLKLSRPVAETDVRLVVWPETATPAPIRYRPWIRGALHGFCDSTGLTLLTGATDYESNPAGDMAAYNSAFLFRPGVREPQRSAKIHLVPFGERIPGQTWFPVLGKLHLGQAEWVPAKNVVVFPEGIGIPAFGCLICFEVVFPEIAADMTRAGAVLLATITNDGWYGNSSGPYQHFELARLRAVAVRRSVVRSAGTGISGLILPTGRVVRTLGYDRAGAIFGSLTLHRDITLAARLSRIWLPFYGGLLAAVLIAIAFRRGKT